MSPRWLIAVALLVTAVPATAQNMVAPAYGNHSPVVVNNFGGGDPYANANSTPMGWYGGGGTLLPGGPLLPGSMTIADRLWVRAEYLLWWTEGMDLPPLVTTSPAGTPQNQAAILGQTGTRVLFGNNEINDDSVSGVRAKAGFWLNNQGTFAIESEYFQLLGAQDDGFAASSNGSTILGRPFFDITNGRETAQLVSFPGLVSGNIRVGSDSDLRSFLINGRAGLCPIGVCNPHDADRIDWIVGYRYLELEDSLTIDETLNSLVVSSPGTVVISDRYQTSNEFNGLQLGITYQTNFNRARLESLLRVAVGNNTQRVQIAGNTAITENGTTDRFNSGLLTQRSNIGTFERDEFTMIPEVGLNLGVRVFDWLDATVGYSVLYFPSVVRAGDQIDSDANPNLFPPEAVPFSGALRPRFRFQESDYWAHGLNLGAEVRF